MQYGSWNEGYRVFDADTSDICNHAILNDCGGYAAPWIGRVSTDSKYLYTTLYYNGCVAKIELSTCAELLRTPVGSWPYGLAFDSQRRYLYVGVNVPGTGTTGSLSVIDTLIDQVICNVSLGGEPGRCIVVGPKDEFVYLVTQNLGSEILYKFAAAPGCGVSGTLTLPGVGRGGISVNPDGKTVYVPDVDGNLVHIIDTVTMTVSGIWSIPSAVGFFVSPDGTHALVVGSSPDIRVFDLLTETVTQTISIPDIGTSFDPGKSIPYWDENNGKVYINLSATEGGVAVLVPEPEPLTGRIAFISPYPYVEGGKLWVMDASLGLSSKVEVPLPPIFRALDYQEWSWDGNWITFLAAKTGEWNCGIYIVKPDGSGFCMVSPDGMDLAHPSFSPDGSQIVGCNSFYYIYICTKVGECNWQTEYLTRGVHPQWSPDGNKIAYSNWGLTYDSDIFVYDLETDTYKKITNHGLGKAFYFSAWSPDGTKLALVELDRNTNKNDLWIIDADGSDPWNLTADWPTSNERYPSWSTDGKYIVFNSDISGNWDIWYTPVNHFDPINFTNSPEHEVMPAITSPVEPVNIPATQIRAAIAEKVEALEKIDAALEKEWAAYEALEELLESGDYGDLKKGDIVTAKQKIHSAIQHQELSKKALERSIEKLEDALAFLGRPLLPNT